MGLYAVYSTVQGPDGNGLLTPDDPALGGHSGSATTTNNTPALASGGFVPDDLKTTVVWATVQARIGAAGAAPTDAWSGRIKGMFYRSGNTVTQVGNGISCDVESTPGLVAVQARWFVDTSTTPNQIVPRFVGLTGKTIAWQWSAAAPAAL